MVSCTYCGNGVVVIYYFVFKWAITKFNFKTPGREVMTEGKEAKLEDIAKNIESFWRKRKCCLSDNYF